MNPGLPAAARSSTMKHPDFSGTLRDQADDGAGTCPFTTRAAAEDSLAASGRQAWRNAARCIGRLHWQSLRVVEARGLRQPDEIFEALGRHLELATNHGRIVPMMTVFAADAEAGDPIRIWNHQLIRYAGYRSADGAVTGDPMNCELTEVAMALGWCPPAERGRFDLLPVIIQAGGRLRYYEWPRGAVMEVPLRHPEHPWFERLGLRWYAVPALSDRVFLTDAEAYPCAPFNGWYMGTEIGARNLADEARYHQLPVVAEKLGLDMRRSRSLWKDRALLVLNEAVIWSFEREGVTLVDHHQASREFMRFCQREEGQGREVSADWSWIVPPMSGSTTPVFHRKYEHREERPDFRVQVPPWKTPAGRELLERHRA
jgi:nitric-oxide synthase